MPPEEQDSVESLKNKLYSRKAKTDGMGDIRTPLSSERPEAPVSWMSAEEANAANPGQAQKKPPLAQFAPPKKKMSLPAKFLIVSVLFFIVALGAAAYMFFVGGNLISPSNIDLQVVLPSLIDSGKATTFQVLIDNRNTSSLQLVDLVIDYPDGTRDPTDATQSLPQARQSIGTVGSGQQLKETASAVFYGQAGDAQKIMVTLEYSVAGSNAVFEKQAEGDFTIGSSPVSLSINAPSQAIAGQQFPMDITVQSNATEPINDVVVQGQYPFGYSYASSQPSATAGGTFWSLGTLQPGASQVIHLVGSIDGQDGDERVFRFLVGSNTDSTDTTVAVPLLTTPVSITVQKPFITGTIAVNGQSGSNISVPAGTPLQGTITWQNNLTTAVSNVQLTLTFVGPALDASSIASTDGFYQSQNQSLTWAPAQEAALASVPPGGTGTLQFSFAALPPGANSTLITNPIINLNLTVAGENQDQSGAPQTVSSAAAAQVSVASSVSLTAQALHFTGPFTNTGPMPPVAEQDTSYAIVWTVKNSANDVANATVQAVLPPYVRFVPAGATGVTYDSGSRTVTWNIGDLPAGVGYSTASQTAAFEVVLTPSASQVGTIPALMGASSFSGQDRFAQVPVSAQAPAPNTTLSESGFVSGMDIVAPK